MKTAWKMLRAKQRQNRLFQPWNKLVEVEGLRMCRMGVEEGSSREATSSAGSQLYRPEVVVATCLNAHLEWEIKMRKRV